MQRIQVHNPTLAEAFNYIISAYLKDVQINEREAKQIVSFFKLITVEKDEVFCKKGQVNTKLGILLSGLLSATYETPKQTNEVSRFFFLPDNFIVADFESFTRQTPARETIIALEKSEMLVISSSEMQRLYREVPKMNFVGRELAELSYIRAMHRIYDLQVLNAEGRVKKFFQDHPSFYNRVGKQEIASYLRMNRNLITKYFKPEKEK
jgi:CRP-like cAMP-binding protein